MKKAVFMILLLVSVFANAQKDVTKFLGIPVDGNKSEMKKKLIAKGFSYNAQGDFLEGEFNGRDVQLFIATNNNKVWRIMVCDANSCDETDIKIRFNKLCDQFSRNKKYIAAHMGEGDYTISESEDISYEMIIRNKRYEAAYFQVPDTNLIDSLSYLQKIKEVLLQNFTEEQLKNPSKELIEKIEQLEIKEYVDITFDLIKNKSVWFLINEKYGRYFISIFYDNEYNHSDGEDL